MWNTHNCFFQIGNKIFWLVAGITMWSDPILSSANLFIFYDESKWIKEIKRTDGQEDLQILLDLLITLQF